ncbi:hypothetical protein BH09ACT8_BH09ACT8_27090 [soil metagenome]
MAEIPLTVDPSRLRTVADRVDRAAAAISRLRIAGLHAEDLPGSAVSGAVSRALVASRLHDVVVNLQAWAAAARMSASAFANAEQNGVARLDRS